MCHLVSELWSMRHNWKLCVACAIAGAAIFLGTARNKRSSTKLASPR